MFKILVVEDDRELNRAVCSFLSSHDYEAASAISADTGYDTMYGASFDLIISRIS